MKKKALKPDFTAKCEICGRANADRHHLITKGAGGTDDPSNILYLCREHHSEVHACGRETFCKKWGLEYKLDIAKALQRINNGGVA